MSNCGCHVQVLARHNDTIRNVSSRTSICWSEIDSCCYWQNIIAQFLSCDMENGGFLSVCHDFKTTTKTGAATIIWHLNYFEIAFWRETLNILPSKFDAFTPLVYIWLIYNVSRQHYNLSPFKLHYLGWFISPAGTL